MNGSEPVYFKEYPTIRVPEFAIRLGMEDTSWHNDATASLTVDLQDKQRLVIWVYCDDPSDRELPMKKFFITVVDENNDPVSGSPELQTNSEIVAEKLCEEVLGERK